MSLLLSARDLSKAFGPQPLFSHLNLDFRQGEKVGLVGPNGAGKSTLLKILAGREEADSGERALRRGAVLGYVPQDDRFEPGVSVREVVLGSLAQESIEDHEKEIRATIVLDQFGFEDDGKLAQNLSGGWRKRLSLASQVIRKPDFLLLDEPTNHLDLPGIHWLEEFLQGAPFGFLVATHDRAFLRAVSRDILELNRVYPEGQFRSDGGYDLFLERKESFLEAQLRKQESVANMVRKETDWLGRKAAARTRKAASRIEDALARREELADLRSRNNSQGSATIDFASTGRQSRKLLVASGLGQSISGRCLFQSLDLTLGPGSRVGLLGPNGSGKSVFLRTLLGQMPPFAGKVDRAEGLSMVLFEQGRAGLDPNQTLARALCPSGDMVRFANRTLHVAAWARQFLFRQEQLEVPVGSLSGGEEARVRLAQMMLTPADVLLLDEPTNDLDIPALEVLEDAMDEFPGALVVVSHDRELLDRVCTEVIGLDGQGGAGMYASVTQWLRAMDELAKTATQAKQARTAPRPAAPSPSKPKKLTYKEQVEFDGMEDAVMKAESLVSHCQERLDGTPPNDHVAYGSACLELEKAQKEVERLYQRWQELEAKVASFRQ